VLGTQKEYKESEEYKEFKEGSQEPEIEELGGAT